MAKILQIANGQVQIGLDDGSLREFSIEHFDFSVQVGDEVDVFENDQKVVISKKSSAVDPNAKSKMVAGLLGIFLGGWGIHNFYLGNTGKAVAQLILGTVGVFLFFIGPLASGIWGLVEGILILTSKPGSSWHQDSNGNELAD